MATAAACDKRYDSTPTTSGTGTSGTGTSSTGTSRTTTPGTATSGSSTPGTTTPGTSTTPRTAERVDNSTPMDQSESSVHIKTTADIRRAILNDTTMSTNAQNCKIITDSTGRVTLRGAVDSQAEKDSIETKAKNIAGATNVENLLEIKVK